MAMKYVNLKKLNSGQYGIVAKATKTDINQIVALKKQEIKEYNKDGIPGIILRELDLMQRYDHPNIMKAIEIICQGNSVYFSMEWVDYSLWSYISKNSKWEGRKKHLYDITCAMIDAMSALAENKTAHYDIKPENVLVQERDGKLQSYLTDFGFAKARTVKDDTSAICTLNYTPPELLFQPRTPGRYSSEQVDVWSMGCVLAEYVLGERLFPSDTHDEIWMDMLSLDQPSKTVLRKINLPKKFEGIKSNDVIKISQRLLKKDKNLDPDFIKLVESMLEMDFLKRPSFRQLQSFEYIKNYPFKTLNVEQRLNDFSHKDYISKYKIFNVQKRRDLFVWIKKFTIQSLSSIPACSRVFFTAFHIFDSFFTLKSKDEDFTSNVTGKDALRYGITAFSLSSNYHLASKSNFLRETVVFSFRVFSLEEIQATEKEMLNVLEWKIGTLHPFAILEENKRVFREHTLFESICNEKFFSMTYDEIVEFVLTQQQY